MTDSNSKKVLFVSHNIDESKEAELLFQSESTKAELAWSAVSCIFSDIKQMHNSVDQIILLEHVNVPHAVPGGITVSMEHWRIDTPATIKHNISNLIVRLILKGGKRQPTAQSGGTTNNVTSSKAAAQATVRVGLESKGRGGKKVSVISGLPLSSEEFDSLTTKLKRSCGTGGTHKDGQIEIQGDHRDKLLTELQKLGYKPKRTGGA